MPKLVCDKLHGFLVRSCKLNARGCHFYAIKKEDYILRLALLVHVLQVSLNYHYLWHLAAQVNRKYNISLLCLLTTYRARA